jgi:hypothetical protein
VTTKEAVALRLAVMDLRITLKLIDDIDAKVEELSKGHSETGKDLIRQAVHVSVNGIVAADLRRILGELEERFPRAVRP